MYRKNDVPWMLDFGVPVSMAVVRRHKEGIAKLDDDAVMLPLKLQCFKPAVAARQFDVCARAAFTTGTGSFAGTLPPSPSASKQADH